MRKLLGSNKYWLVALIVIMALLTGCQSKVVDEAETLVAKAEQEAKDLKSELEYDKRLADKKDGAFSAPDEKVVSETNLAYEEAQAVMQDIKDEKIKAELQKRLDEVKDKVEIAEVITNAVKKSTELDKKGEEFQQLLTTSPLDENVEKELASLKEALADKEEFMESLPSDWQKAYDESVIKNGASLLEDGERIVTIRTAFGELSKLIADKAKNEDIEKKSNELEGLISAIKMEDVKKVVGSKKTDTLKPYVARVAEEKRIAEEKQKAEELAKAKAEEAKNQQPVASNTPTKKPSTSSSNKKPSTSSGSTGSTTTTQPKSPAPAPAPSLNAVAKKVKPVCDRYGLVTMGAEGRTSGQCSKSGSLSPAVQFGGSTVMSGGASYVSLAVDVALTLGANASRSELIEAGKWAVSNPRTPKQVGSVRVYSDNGGTVSIDF